MGDVWRARDTRLDRDVAIKELKRNLVDDEIIRCRFLREVRITSQLDHPGIVPVYDLLPDENGRPRYGRCLAGAGGTLAGFCCRL
jgi:serine/threonine-protein kinase